MSFQRISLAANWRRDGWAGKVREGAQSEVCSSCPAASNGGAREEWMDGAKGDLELDGGLEWGQEEDRVFSNSVQLQLIPKGRTWKFQSYPIITEVIISCHQPRTQLTLSPHHISSLLPLCAFRLANSPEAKSSGQDSAHYLLSPYSSAIALLFSLFLISLTFILTSHSSLILFLQH